MEKRLESIYDPDYVRGLFNRMSSSYERMNYITSFGFSIRWRTQFLDHFPKSDGNVEIIDLLTGMGETWAATRQKFPNANLTVLDFSEGMLKYAKQKSKTKFNGNINIVQQDLLKNELPDNHYDFVTCAFGLKTFNEDQLEIIAGETKRILKPGGHFSFIEVSQPENKLLHFFYALYLGRVIPVLGWLLLGNPREYKMLWTYTSNFKNSKSVKAIFEKAELNTRYVSYFGGCASGLFGQKEQAKTNYEHGG